MRRRRKRKKIHHERERERETEKSVQKRIERNNKIGLFFFSNIVWIVEIIIKRI